MFRHAFAWVLESVSAIQAEAKRGEMMANIIAPVDQYAIKHQGTTPWADWQRSRMRHALKNVHWKPDSLSKVIRDMCSGETPAWKLKLAYNIEITSGSFPVEFLVELIPSIMTSEKT